MKDILEPLLSKLKPGKYEFDDEVLEYQLTDNGYMVRVYSKNTPDPELKKYVNAFKEYVKDVDDDIFLEACEMFPDVSGMSTHEFANLLDKSMHFGKVCSSITLFKDCIKKVAGEKVRKMKEKYLV